MTAPRTATILVSALVALLGGLLGAAAPRAAAQSSQACPAADPTYTGPCGPTFVLPSWGDAGGWKDPSQYSTIQLADIDGDGADELLGRTPAGLAVHKFDTTYGEWRPQVNADNVPVILSEFANPPYLTTANPNPPATDWTQPWYYDTIQTADIDGQPGEEILGRSSAGMIVFKYTAGASGQAGSWSQLSSSGPFSDNDGFVNNPSTYTTIQTGDLDGNGDYELIGRTSSGLEAYDWTGSSWSSLPGIPFLSDRNGFNQAQYYADIQVSNWTTGPRDNVSNRIEEGVTAVQLTDGHWQGLADDVPFSPFPSGGPGCCFSNGNSWADSPSYYSTIQYADITGGGGDELIGRGGDGLVAWFFTGDTPQTGWKPLGTLSALSDANNWNQPQYYETIQTANIDGVGAVELLARGPQGVSAYSFNPITGWSAVSNSLLALQDDPWANDPSYYSTIQAGDVDGDGQDELIGRGPYGIRTWFFNRRGTGTWERYLPYGYPAFSTQGRRAAYSELNSQARARGDITGTEQTVRDVWASENAPGASTLAQLNSDLLAIGNCSGETSQNPPQYSTCTPPSGSSGFTAADWTAVMNEIFAELYWAQQVVAFLGDSGLGGAMGKIFLSENASLPALDAQLQLAQAETVNTQFDLVDAFSNIAGIAGTIAGEEPGIGTALWIVSELLSIFPSGSPTLTGTLQGTYDQLVNTFATGFSEAENVLNQQSQLIRQDRSLLSLVAQLYRNGTWNLDLVGMESAAQQGFSLWVYQTLLPTIWARYGITNCVTSPPGTNNFIDCQPPPTGPWLICSGSCTSFSALGPPQSAQYPCFYATESHYPYDEGWDCWFQGVPNNPTSLIWGQIQPRCAYQPGNSNTAWTYGCNLGVDPQKTINVALVDPFLVTPWDFPTYQGSPETVASSAGVATGIGARTAALSLRGRVALPRRVNLRRAAVTLDRFLYEPGNGELVRAGGRRAGRLALKRARPRSGVHGAFASPAARRPRARLRLRRVSRARLAFRLRLGKARLPVPPNACSGTRPGIDLAARPVLLHTRLRIRTRRGRPVVIPLKFRWRCRRNALGTVSRLVLSRPRRLALPRRPLELRVRGPRGTASKRAWSYRVAVHNPGRSPAYDGRVHARLAASSGGRSVWRFRRLGPGRTRVIRFKAPVIRRAAGSRCPVIVAIAIRTRPARTSACTGDGRPAARREPGQRLARPRGGR